MTDRVESADERTLRRELQELAKKREALDNSKRRGSGPAANGVAGRRSVFARLGAEPMRGGNRQIQLKENNTRGNMSRRLGKRENEDNRQSSAAKRQRLHSAVARPEGSERTETSRISTAATSPSVDNARAQQRKQRAVAPYAQKDGIARSRRMFGALMGHLGKAKRQIEKDTDLFKRQDSKQHEAEQREKLQSQDLENRARHEAEVAKLEALLARTELDHSEQIARAKLEHLTMVRKSESQSKFLVTISSPPIYYLPTRHTKETEDLIAASVEAHEAKMKAKTQRHEENLRKLEAEFATKLEQLREELDAAKSGGEENIPSKDTSREKKDDAMEDVDADMDHAQMESEEPKQNQQRNSDVEDSEMPENHISDESANGSAMDVEDEDIVHESVSVSESNAPEARSNGDATRAIKNAGKPDPAIVDGATSSSEAVNGAEGKSDAAPSDVKAPSSSRISEESEQVEEESKGVELDDQPVKAAEIEESKPATEAAANGDANLSKDAAESEAPAKPKKDWSAVGKMKVTELRKELKKRGLDVKGLKATLVQRLKEAMQEEDEAT